MSGQRREAGRHRDGHPDGVADIVADCFAGHSKQLGPNDSLTAIVGAGDVVWAMDTDTGGAGIVLVRSDGTRDVLAESAANTSRELYFAGVSADRAKLAWSVSDPSEGTSTLTYADANTAKVLNTTDLGQPKHVVGFVADQVVVASSPGGASLWHGSTDTVEDWPGTVGAFATAPAAGHVAVAVPRKPAGAETPCAAVVSRNALADRLWESCDWMVSTFSPDGTYASAIRLDSDGLGPGELRIVDARTGEEPVSLRAELLQAPVWESGQAVLVSAHVGGEWAIVRCTVTGACELATEPRKGPPEEPTLYAVHPG